MNDGRCQSLFFINLPELQKLCAVKVTICSQLAATEIRTAQRKMCRQLLLRHQDVLSSPVPGRLDQLSMVMTVPFYKSGKLQSFIESHGATMASPERVLPPVFQTCLSYTLIARLAPRWNQAGHLLIQGKDFLSQRGKQNAVVMDISVSDNQLCVSAEVCTIRLPPPELEDFDISANIIKKFDADHNAVIDRYSILSNWCYILPSMKMGQIVSISHTIPADSALESYNALKLYWENLYGYILPEDPQVYCNIYFKLIGEQIFTYPLNCTRSRPVQYFPRVDLEGVLKDFVADLKNTIPFICGCPVKMSSKPLYATKDLAQSSTQSVNTMPVNLTGKRSWKVALTQAIPRFSHSLCAATEKSRQMERQIKQPKTGVFSNLLSLAEDANIRAAECNLYRKKQKSGDSTVTLSSNESFRLSKDSLMRDSTRIIPIFKGKLLHTDRQATKNIHGKKKQNAAQYMPMGSLIPAKLTVFQSSAFCPNKPLQDASFRSNVSRKSNVKSSKQRPNEKTRNKEYLSNSTVASTMGLAGDARKTKSVRVHSFLVSASNQSIHGESAVQLHKDKPANLSTGKKSQSTGSKKSHLSKSRPNIEEKNGRIFQNQMQSSAEESKMNTKRGRGQKESVRLSVRDTTKKSCHQLQFISLQEEEESYPKAKKLKINK